MADTLLTELDESFTETANRADRPLPTGKKALKLKAARYAKKDPLPRMCKHTKKKAGEDQSIYLCNTINNDDIQFFNSLFFKNENKKTQDNFITLYIETQKKSRERKRKTVTMQKRQRDSGGTKFFIRREQSSTKLRICKDFFLRILGGIGRRRVENIASDMFKTGCVRKEKRGGDRKSLKFADCVSKIKYFIRSMPGRESHYGREKSKKVYLPAELSSIKRLWRMFLQKHPEEAQGVSYKYFLRCVRKFFRIGFGSIKTDACSFCESHRYQIKNEKDTVARTRLMAELSVHKRRANVFYELIKENRPGLKTFSFDHQQNLVLPGVADQQAYYSRQFYVYNLGLVEITADGKLNTQTVTSYTWTEDVFRKDSSVCASAVFDALKKADMTGIDTVRLCCDGCGGQNKNTGLIYMAGHWLREFAPNHVKNVELVFPVRGHSFLPSDRYFGLIEKDIRKEQSLYSPHEYHNMFAQHATVKQAEVDWPVLSFKGTADSVFKKPFPIGVKVKDNKRFYILKSCRNSIKVSGEMSYRNLLNVPAVVTEAKKHFGTQPSLIPKRNLLTEAKKKDVKSLMTAHCGNEDWMNNDRFSYLINMVNSENTADASHDCDGESVCTCLEEDTPSLSI